MQHQCLGSLKHDGVVPPSPSCDRILVSAGHEHFLPAHPSVNSAIGLFLAELRKEKSLLAEGIELVSDTAMPPPNKRLRRTCSGSKFCRWDSNGSITNRVSVDSLPTLPGGKRDRDLSASHMANFAWDTTRLTQPQQQQHQSHSPSMPNMANYTWGVDSTPSLPARRSGIWGDCASSSFASRQGPNA